MTTDLRSMKAERARRTVLSAIGDHTHLIWDWNGTLLDDVSLCTQVIGEVMREHALQPISEKQYRSVFGFPVVDYYRKLGFDFGRVPFEIVGDRFILKYAEQCREARLFDGVPELLSTISSLGIQQSILSAASQWHLDEVTAHFGVRDYFVEICGIDNHYAASKVERGRELMKKAKFPIESTLLIGDTDHDLEVARELGVNALLIADGHQSYERLCSVHGQVLQTRFAE